MIVMDSPWSKKILVVDDDPALTNYLGLRLGKVGYEVLVAENGQRGFEEAIEKEPDIILLDINMPGKVDGFETLKRVRSENKLDQVPVIMLTVQNDRGSISQALSMKANDYIIKPLKMGLLINRMEKLLNKNVEDKWKNLDPALLELLNLTQETLLKTFQWALEKDGDFPLEDIKHVCRNIIKAVEDNKIQLIFDAIENHNNEIFVHALKVTAYMVIFARKLNEEKIRFSEDHILDLAMGGLLHDLGMVDVQFIIKKADSLLERDKN